MTGICACGCGEATHIATRTDRSTSRVKGEPMRFVHGHNARGHRRGPITAAEYTVADHGHATPCWIWNGAPGGNNGYGWVRIAGVKRPAHRVMYEQSIGPIRHGLELDHLCRVPLCVRPDHLEPVTHEENCRRGLRGDLRRPSRWSATVDACRVCGRSDSRHAGFGVCNRCRLRAVKLGDWPRIEADL